MKTRKMRRYWLSRHVKVLVGLVAASLWGQAVSPTCVAASGVAFETGVPFRLLLQYDRSITPQATNPSYPWGGVDASYDIPVRGNVGYAILEYGNQIYEVKDEPSARYGIVVSNNYVNCPTCGSEDGFSAGITGAGFSALVLSYALPATTFNSIALPDPIQTGAWPGGIAPGAGGPGVLVLSVSRPVQFQARVNSWSAASCGLVDSVEVTQATQELQPIELLKRTLALNDSREPPIPLVSGKPAAIRVYLTRSMSPQPVEVQVAGVINRSFWALRMPDCSPDAQRRREGSCTSADFFFDPPPGNWTLSVTVRNGSGEILEEHRDLPFRSRASETIRMVLANMCGVGALPEQPICPPIDLTSPVVNSTIPLTEHLRAILPGQLESKRLRNAIDFPRRSQLTGLFGFLGRQSESEFLFDNALRALVTVSKQNDPGAKYVGLLSPQFPELSVGDPPEESGLAESGRRGAVVLADTQIASFVTSHEVGHLLGLNHAGSCVLSSDTKEIGFFVAGRLPILPERTGDLVTDCKTLPSDGTWVSPSTYRSLLRALLPASLRTASSTDRAGTGDKSTLDSPGSNSQPALINGTFHTVSGVIYGQRVHWHPVFKLNQLGQNETGTGSHVLEVRGPSGVLFQRRFTPEAVSNSVDAPRFFSEEIPDFPSATSFVLLDTTGAPLSTLLLGPPEPTVAILNPTGTGRTLSGRQVVAWSTNVPYAWVQYSHDGGATWLDLGKPAVPFLSVDFDKLPGATASGLIRVLVSNGGRSTSATTQLFTIPKKASITATVEAPRKPVSLTQSNNGVWLQGSGFDVDDGDLQGQSLVWRSNLDGEIGRGSSVFADRLRGGSHLIVLEARDSDGNVGTSSPVIVNVTATRPTVSISTQVSSAGPSCFDGILDARVSPGAAAIRTAQLSVDGGRTYQEIHPGLLPFRFRVPGSGYVRLIGRVVDDAGQPMATEQSLNLTSTCIDATPRLAGALVAKGTHSNGTLWIDLALTNSGVSPARAVRVASVAVRVLAGTGTPSVNTTLSPGLPANIGDIRQGETKLLRLYINVPNSVTRISVTENGTFQDSQGRVLSFSLSQAAIL